MQTCSSFFKNISTTIVNGFNNVKTWLSSLGSDISNSFGTWFTKLGTWISNVEKAVTSAISNVVTSVTDWFKNTLDSLYTWFSNVGTWITTVNTTVIDWFKSLLANLGDWFKSIGDWFVTLGDNIKGFFEDIKEWFVKNFTVDMELVRTESGLDETLDEKLSFIDTAKDIGNKFSTVKKGGSVRSFSVDTDKMLEDFLKIEMELPIVGKQIIFNLNQPYLITVFWWCRTFIQYSLIFSFFVWCIRRIRYLLRFVS